MRLPQRALGLSARRHTMRAIARWALAVALAFAGAAHLLDPDPFMLLVPSWVPWSEVAVVVTGVMEVSFGVMLAFAPAGSVRRITGWAVTAFLIVVFVGNVSQAVSGADAFGLDTDVERWGRLVFQPLLIAWALWSTSALRYDDRAKASRHSAGGTTRGRSTRGY